MFDFLKPKRTPIEGGLFRGLTDCHSHILPAVDDGVQSVEEAIGVLDWYERIGVRRVMFTPHIMEDLPRNSAENLRAKFASFKELYSGTVEITLAAEYMLDSKFDSHIESGDMLTLWDNYILVESSYILPPLNFVDTLRRIMSKGYFVVLAHPERYLFLRPEDYREMKSLGVKFQLNIPSICGSYGGDVRRRAVTLLDEEFYDFVGSDLHSLDYHSRIMADVRLSPKILEKMLKIGSTPPRVER